MVIVVVKRDSKTEPFSYDKLVSSILKAGVPSGDAELIATNIKNSLVTNTKDGRLNSTVIRDKIVDALKIDFPLESETYETYKKT